MAHSSRWLRSRCCSPLRVRTPEPDRVGRSARVCVYIARAFFVYLGFRVQGQGYHTHPKQYGTFDCVRFFSPVFQLLRALCVLDHVDGVYPARCYDRPLRHARPPSLLGRHESKQPFAVRPHPRCVRYYPVVLVCSAFPVNRGDRTRAPVEPSRVKTLGGFGGLLLCKMLWFGG